MASERGDEVTRRSVGPESTGDPPARAPAPSRAGDLPLRIGRYTITGQLGRGGMGVVYRAHDDELDRSLAIKLLHASRALADPQGRARFQREAQAMAQLSHPNVVQIYDVGEYERQIFVAMELIRGETLREWCNPPRGPRVRPWREVVAVFVQAGQGLAAAHDAAIVHRDFKPENVFVAADGRVRVGDFGLARRGADDEAIADDEATEDGLHGASASLTAPGTLLGTPAYMSPEQHLRTPADARSDQFAFCVALWEALYGVRPFAGETLGELARAVLRGAIDPPPPRTRVPRWLRRAALRGLAVRASARHPSMHALLAELQRGPARARTRLLSAGLAAAALVGAGAWGQHALARADRADACAAAGASIAEVWGPDTRKRVRAAFVSTGLAHAPATVDRLIPWLDRQADAWSEARRETCLDAELRGTSDADAAERASWCLEERRDGMAMLVEQFLQASPPVVTKAVGAAAGLAPVATCRDPAALARLPIPPHDRRGEVRDVRASLSRAGNLKIAGQYDRALTEARAALARAEAIGWQPLVALAHLAVGTMLAKQGEYADARVAQERAYVLANESDAFALAADAATSLIFLVGVDLGDHAEGLHWSRLAESALRELAVADEPREADRLNYHGSVLQGMGKYDEARAAHQAALAIEERVLGPNHPAVAVTLNGLAVVDSATGKFVEARALFARSLAILEQAFGPDHPDVASPLSNVANMHFSLGDYAGARPLHARALEIREKAFGPDHPSVAQSLNNLAGVTKMLGDFAAARPLYERSLAIREKTFGPHHRSVAGSLLNLAAVLKRYPDERAAATQALERALAIRERELGADHPDVGVALRILAMHDHDLGADEQARARATRARTIHEKNPGPRHHEYASDLCLLGELHLAAGEHTEAAALLEQSIETFEQSLGVDHPDLIECLHVLADVRRAAADAARARSLDQRALQIGEKALGAAHAGLALPLQGLAEVALHDGEPAEAVSLAARALTLLESSHETPRRIAGARFVLAQARWLAAPDAGGDRAQAHTLAVQAHDALAGDVGAERKLAAVARWLATHPRP